MIYDLLEKAQQGDKDAMQELIDRFQPLLRKYARKLGYDDAYEDCLLKGNCTLMAFRLNIDVLMSHRYNVYRGKWFYARGSRFLIL